MNSQTNQMFVAQSVNGPFSIDAKAYLTSKIRKVTLNDEITKCRRKAPCFINGDIRRQLSC